MARIVLVEPHIYRTGSVIPMNGNEVTLPVRGNINIEYSSSLTVSIPLKNEISVDPIIAALEWYFGGTDSVMFYTMPHWNSFLWSLSDLEKLLVRFDETILIQRQLNNLYTPVQTALAYVVRIQQNSESRFFFDSPQTYRNVFSIKLNYDEPTRAWISYNLEKSEYRWTDNILVVREQSAASLVMLRYPDAKIEAPTNSTLPVLPLAEMPQTLSVDV